MREKNGNILLEAFTAPLAAACDLPILFRDGQSTSQAFSTTSLIIQISGDAQRKRETKNFESKRGTDRPHRINSYRSFLCAAVRPSLSPALTPALPARAAALARSTSRWLPRDIGGKGGGERGRMEEVRAEQKIEVYFLLQRPLFTFFFLQAPLDSFQVAPRLLNGGASKLHSIPGSLFSSCLAVKLKPAPLSASEANAKASRVLEQIREKQEGRRKGIHRSLFWPESIPHLLPLFSCRFSSPK